MAYNFPDNLIYLGIQTASSSADLSFTSLITSNWTTYYVLIRNLLPATDGTTLNMTFSNDNGSSYLSANYKYTRFQYPSTGTTAAVGSTSAANCELLTLASNGASAGISGGMYFYNLTSASVPPYYHGQLVHYNNASASVNVQVGGMNTDTTGINALKWAFSSGNIASGTITLYGVQEP